MKKTLLILTVSSGLLFASCGKSDTKAVDTKDAGDVASATEQSVTYNIDKEGSEVIWTGSKVLQGGHTGTIAISEGSLSTENGTISAGNFVVDMSSIMEAGNDDEESRTKLVGHLKSADFFNVDTFSTATFEIIEGGADKVKGNLTIKGITKQIEIPVTTETTDDGLVASSTFTINRNDWGITWGNGSTHKIDFLKDNFINDNIEFDVRLVATK